MSFFYGTVLLERRLWSGSRCRCYSCLECVDMFRFGISTLAIFGNLRHLCTPSPTCENHWKCLSITSDFCALHSWKRLGNAFHKGLLWTCCFCSNFLSSNIGSLLRALHFQQAVHCITAHAKETDYSETTPKTKVGSKILCVCFDVCSSLNLDWSCNGWSWWCPHPHLSRPCPRATKSLFLTAPSLTKSTTKNGVQNGSFIKRPVERAPILSTFVTRIWQESAFLYTKAVLVKAFLWTNRPCFHQGLSLVHLSTVSSLFMRAVLFIEMSSSPPTRP